MLAVVIFTPLVTRPDTGDTAADELRTEKSEAESPVGRDAGGGGSMASPDLLTKSPVAADGSGGGNGR